MQLTPTIYARGRYTVKEPFSLLDGIDYTCHAIRTFQECEERGIDVWVEVYEKVGLDRAVYLEDSSKGINVIALSTDGESTVYIPDSHITSYPNMGEAIPQRIVVSVDLGVISSHWDPQYLLTQITNLASDIVGGEPEANIHAIPLLGRVSSDDVPVLEAIREIDINNRTSDYAKRKELEKRNALLNDKVIALEQKVLNP